MKANHLLYCGAAVLCGAILTPAFAAGRDCAPLGSLPSYVADSSGPELRDYQSADFDVQAGDASHTVTVAGRYCKLDYTPKDGTEPLSDLEIQSNYREQLGKLGAQVLFSDDRNTEGKIVRNGQETWFKIYSQETEIDITVVVKQPPKQVLTAPSGNDYRLLGHMPNYTAGTPEKRNFDKLEFDVKNSDEQDTVEVQGARYSVNYSPRDGVQANSDLDIQENYRTALKALGAQLLFTDERNTDARLEHDGQTIWVRIYSQETEIDIGVIEEKAFQATIQTPQASALKTALDKDGHVALYINFDFDKATLRPDAAPVIAQVVALLKDAPTLKLSIEGHTDNVGSHDYNLKLSQDRAASVVAALVKAGIAADRLSSAGHGPDQPIADNKTGEGRARNRRVELVKR
ncbi:OmpA family protein [Solimonas terrae]|uniref:OmpA family protein n=1 Tax=Solimonas terrae TaxID=1396819 RepID=A0A6M2BRK3_9GAMM|nr:OmpA family protein [Solimonas terrae]NGY05236.1 OmpA family protein [Solimonas terrae]